MYGFMLWIILVWRASPSARCRGWLARLGEFILSAIRFGQKWTVCETKNFQKLAPKCHHSFGHLLPLLIMEQTPTALLVDCHRDDFGTAHNRSSTSPHVFGGGGQTSLLQHMTVHACKTRTQAYPFGQSD